MSMEIPAGVPTCELRSSVLWFGDNGVLYSTPKPDAEVDLTIEQVAEDMKKFRAFVGGKKVCLVSESNPNSKPPKKEQRDFIASEIESVVKAMAIVTSSPLSRMIANLFFSFKPPTYPVKMFTTEADATQWVKQYL